MIDRLNAALEGRYRIERELGEGGMAFVYLADDLKHDRKVALKVLKSDLAQMLGKDRFLTEIRTTANLQHPNILPLFDSGEADGFLFYVMPFVEGETLRDRLEREVQLPVDQSLDLIRKVASALEYAHGKNIVHRDLKPANILLSSGEPLIADFGIALAVQQAGDGRMTQTGLSMGTPQYMSPEQASGDRSLDPRSDIYALGAVLYELLSGDPPFAGSSAQAVLARILTTLPARVTVQRPTVPPHVDAAIARSLEKIPADRFTTAADFRKALDDPGFRHTTVTHIESGDQPKIVVRRKGGPLIAALAVVAVLALGIAAVGWLRPAPEVRVTVWEIELPLGDFTGTDFDVSPDGRTIVYLDTDQNLMLRDVGSLGSTAVPGAEGVRAPFFSPEGSALLFARGAPSDAGWVTTPVSGGTIAEATGGIRAVSNFAAWSEDGWLYFMTPGDGPVLFRARAGGGRSEVIETERPVNWRSAIPGRPGMLLAQGAYPDSIGGQGLQTVDTETGVMEPIEGLRGADSGRFAGDYLFWVTETDLLVASRFDFRTLQIVGETVTLAERIPMMDGYAISQSGLLMYVSREAGTSRGGSGLGESLAFVTRNRDIEIIDSRLATDYGDFDAVRMSPNGRYLAAQFQRGADGSPDREDHIVVYDTEETSGLQLTFEGTRNGVPRWVGDERLMYLSNRSGQHSLWIEPRDRSTSAELIWETEWEIHDFDVAETDPELIVVAIETPEDAPVRSGIYRLDVGGDPELIELVATPSYEWAVDISPDGRWFAYNSDETSRPEIYVRALPDGGRPWPVSTQGGFAPKWSRDGSEIFYEGMEDMMVATVEAVDGVRVLDRVALFPSNGFEFSQGDWASYDIDAEGRIVVTAESFAQASSERNTRPVVISNVFALIEQRLAEMGGG